MADDKALLGLVTIAGAGALVWALTRKVEAEEEEEPPISPAPPGPPPKFVMKVSSEGRYTKY